MPQTADGKPSQDAIDAFDMRRSGMSWRMISDEFRKRGKDVSPKTAETISYQYLTWSREEARRKSEEASDFRVFSLFDIDWYGRYVNCSLPHKQGGFINPVFISVAKPGESSDDEILDMIKAMREHAREHHGI